MSSEPHNPLWRMGGITVPEVEDYLYEMLPPRDEVLAEMEDDAAKNDYAIVGPAVARVLYQLAVISGAKNIFEMGSAIGYSTIWWARAMGEDGRSSTPTGIPSAPKRRGGILSGQESPNVLKFAWETRWNFFRNKKNNTTLFSTTSTKPIIRGYFG